MKNKFRINVLKVVVFIAIAMGTALFVNKLNNTGLSVASSETAEPVLPTAYCRAGGKTVNMMYGYTQVMNTSFMRKGIVPVTEDQTVNLFVSDGDGYTESGAYELRSISGDILIERGDLVKSKDEQGYDIYRIELRMDLTLNTEYALCLVLNKDTEREVRYYTRVVRLREEHVASILNYVSEFHSGCFEKEYVASTGNLVSNALTDPEEGENSTLSHVDLNSSYEAVTFGDLAPMTITPLVPTVTEIDSEYANVSYSYVVESSVTNDNHYYRVDEYYTLHYNKSSGEVELLAFDRYMDSYYDENTFLADNNAISMGIVKDTSVEYKSTENYRRCAFVREGQLWCYDYMADTISCVFSFPMGSYKDVRVLNPDVDINILDMEEDGSIDFCVYGYMSRGIHEGKNGISLMHYNNENAYIEELFFLSCDAPFDVMKRETGRFTYFDKKNHLFYCLFDGALYQISVDTMEMTTLMSELSSESYFISSDMRIAAYPNKPSVLDANGIVIRNFETGEEIEKTGSENERYKLLGFVNDDVIYGKARAEDIVVTSYGEAIAPLFEVDIVSPEGENLKSYKKQSIFIMNTRVETDTIYLERVVRRDAFFNEIEPDYISYNRENTGDSILLLDYNDTYAKKQKVLSFPTDMYVGSRADYRRIKEKNENAAPCVSVKGMADERDYYVYSNIGFHGAYESCGKAILVVNELPGSMVVDARGSIVYRGIAADSYNTVGDKIRETKAPRAHETLLTCAYMCIRYLGYDAELSEVLTSESFEDAFAKYTYDVGLNISGVDLSTALYFLDRDCPFVANIGNNHYVLVISYNSTHIRYYDPAGDEEIKVTRAEFEALMNKGANELYTFAAH